MKASTQLRELLRDPGMVVAPGCIDPISGLICKQVGFKALYITGSGTEAAMLGNPDLGLKTLTEITTLAGRVADATGLPVICDAEAGFGSYINMIRAVKEFEKAGVAAIHVEDQTTPTTSPGLRPRQILSRAEAVGKIKAAVDARTDPDFVIIARSDADEISIDEVIARCNLYLEAGADLAMPIVSKIDGQMRRDLTTQKVLDTFRRVCREIHGPLLGLAMPEGLTVREIEQFGFKLYIYPGDVLQAAVGAVFEVMKELKDTGATKGYFDRRPRMDPAIYRRLIRTDEWLALEKKYGAQTGAL